MIETIFDYTDPDEHVFDDSKIIITSNASLVATSPPPEAYLYAKLDETQGLVARDTSSNERDGALKGTWNSNDWSTSGKFGNGIEGDGGGRIEFSPYGSFERTQAFSIEFWFRITSGAVQLLVSRQKNTAPFSGYAVNIQSGVLFFLLRDSTTARIQIKTANTYNDGALHHFVATYDGSSSDTGMKIYIDNAIDKVVDVSGTLTNTIINTVKLQLSGKDGNNNPTATGSIINDMAIYARELTAADVSFRWNSGAGTQVLPGDPVTFPTDNPTIVSKTFIGATLLNGTTADIVATGNDAIKAIVQVNSEKYYFNGSDWAISDETYAQTSTIAEINTNLPTLISQSSDVRLIYYLHSDDGSSTPVLNESAITYEFTGGVEASDLSFCNVFWYAFSPDGTICTDQVTAVLSSKNVRYKDNDFICKTNISAFPDPTTGLVELNLVENVNMVNQDNPSDPVTYIIKQGANQIAQISVPDQPNALLWDILV